jgi:hypothetical protein
MGEAAAPDPTVSLLGDESERDHDEPVDSPMDDSCLDTEEEPAVGMRDMQDNNTEEDGLTSAQDMTAESQFCDSQSIKSSSNMFTECSGGSANSSGKKDKDRNTCTGKTAPGPSTIKKLPPPAPVAKNGDYGTPSAVISDSSFPPQYKTIRAARSRVSNSKELRAVGSFYRVGAGRSSDGPGFMVAGDERQFGAQNYHVTDGGRNVSTSVSAGDLRCLACGLRHSYRESIAGGSLVVVVLCDQSFPPILPSNSGNSAVIIRIEDGLVEASETRGTTALVY